MRPIYLKLAGLNSFRETQVIDFSVLGETGVFGIFGPTGSGKSSILDAITLALYGTVERAPNHTQGILNHAEKQLSVEFKFTLGVGEKKRVFRAERSYKRSGDKTLKAAVCRLVEIEGGIEKVLAAKSEDMTSKITEVIGLKAEDFTRAVVLPQGKFAEFLTIRPSDRRLMLERLFALENYGQKLTNTLKEELHDTDFKLNGVEQRLQGLGDASAARVADAEKEFSVTDEAVTALHAELNRLQKAYEEAKEVWSLQEEWERVTQREAELIRQLPYIQELKQRLSLAEQAEQLRPLVEDVSQAEDALVQVELRIQEVARRLDLARTSKDATEQEWNWANQVRVENEPRIQRRIEQIKQAQALEHDRSELDSQLGVMRSEYEKFAKDQRTLQSKIDELSQQLAVKQAKRDQGRLRLVEITVEPSQRKIVNEAVKALEAYQIINSQWLDVAQQLDQKQREIKVIVQQADQAELIVEQAQNKINGLGQAQLEMHSLAPDEEALSTRMQEVERLRALLDNIERVERNLEADQDKLAKLQDELGKFETEMAMLNASYSRVIDNCLSQEKIVDERMNILTGLEKDNLAGTLVERLTVNEPCPVCGSVDHPSPAEHLEPARLVKSKEEYEFAKIGLKKLEEEKLMISSRVAEIKATLNSRKEYLASQTGVVAESRQLLSQYRAGLPPTEQAQPITVLQEKLVNQEQGIIKEREAFISWKSELERVKQEIDDAQNILNQALERNAGIRTDQALITGVAQELDKRLKYLEQERAERLAHLDQIRENNDISELSLLHEKYTRWDQELASLNKVQAAVEEEMTSLEQLRTKIDLEKRDIDLKLKELESIGKEAGKTLAGIIDKIQVITEGRSPEKLLLDGQEELASLIKLDESKKVSYEDAKKALVGAEQEQAILNKEVEIQRIGFEKAQNKLKMGLAETAFLSADKVLEALFDIEQRRDMDDKIKKYYQDEVVLRERSAELKERLGSRSLTGEDWAKWPIRLREAETNHQEGLERRGATQNAWRELRERHLEWLKLEQERGNLSHRYDLLRQLQTVLKGNAFVEYVAEEQLMNVALDASERLGQLTNHRYALEVDSDGGFRMRDDANGGVHRPVSTLSGGETFLTSLALALALSVQIQLRGESPLEFFFLDEGFGTLDPNLLEVVINTLEKLHLQNLTIGIISHVPELKNRLARRLIVIPAEPGGAGSKVKLEMA